MDIFAFARAALLFLLLHMTRRRRAYLALLFAFALLIAGRLLIAPPSPFPSGTVITVERNAPFAETARFLEAEGLIRSSTFVRGAARLSGADTTIRAGRYFFPAPENALSILSRLRAGESGLAVVRVTFPEGYTAREMARTLESSLPGFDAETFLAHALPHEGELFPDTYDFFPDAAPEEVVKILTETFEARFATLAAEYDAFGRSREDIVIMASLIEREARVLEDKRMIAGILWDRVDIGMALQVDAVFGYINDRETYHPSLEDLEVDSAYNTYRYPGLPPGPISNPGLESLLAAMTPTKSEYLYYLTGRDGNMYYARTFEEHRENRARYLD